MKPEQPEIVSAIPVVRDTCNVYVLRSGRNGVLVDLGSGTVLNRLDELGLDRVTDVLVTHHHRDQVQGLARAAAAGIRIWVPPVEEELVAEVERYWESR
jgi:glyoxylase-like metal-dependent hydrolase (beta-lactamase superfamily II)